METPNKLH
jgi:NADH:ubiquinone oxidoreductase subunit B-like Fe-S oxidoreductase